MSTPIPMSNCPSEETLAAFIDGRLDSRARRHVIAHIAICPDCHAIVTASWDYVATAEPMDKAGAYGIQGYGAALVEWVDGDYFAVMGLPLQRMVRMFNHFGWYYNFNGLQPE